MSEIIDKKENNKFKSILRFLKEPVISVGLCWGVFFCAIIAFSCVGNYNNSSTVNEKLNELEIVNDHLAGKETEKITLESEVDELKNSNDDLEDDFKKLESELEKLKNTTIE